jgi:hypothetical protein
MAGDHLGHLVEPGRHFGRIELDRALVAERVHLSHRHRWATVP